jgi:hypothetical protein
LENSGDFEALKAQPYKLENGVYTQCSPSEADHIMLHMKGPFPDRMIPVILKGSRKDKCVWSWNGDVEKPTLKPSIRTRGVRRYTDEEIERVRKGEHIELPDELCHIWVNDGKVIYLNDCTHEFAGQTHDLLDVE